MRHIPTPCRGVTGIPRCLLGTNSDIDLFSLQIGETLLEESLRHPDCEAFFLARTLVETIVEHQEPDGEPNRRDSPSPEVLCLGGQSDPPATLSLDALLPCHDQAGSVASCAPEWFALDRGQCELPLDDTKWRDISRFVPLKHLLAMPPNLHRPERFSGWIAQHLLTESITIPDCSTLCITSDGSFSPNEGFAGWGVTVSYITPDVYELPGVHVGQIGGRTSDIWDLGGHEAGPINAFASELVGLIWAAVVCFQLHFDIPVVFRCDNQAALAISTGHSHRSSTSGSPGLPRFAFRDTVLADSTPSVSACTRSLR